MSDELVNEMSDDLADDLVDPDVVQRPHLELVRFVRANTSSLIGTGLDWFVVAALTNLGLFYLFARPVGAFAGAVLDFTIKRRWAFVRTAKRGLRAESIRYLLVSATSLLCNVLVCYLLVEVGGMRVGTAVVTGSLLVGVCWNYPLHRLFVFRDAERG